MLHLGLVIMQLFVFSSKLITDLMTYNKSQSAGSFFFSFFLFFHC